MHTHTCTPTGHAHSHTGARTRTAHASAFLPAGSAARRLAWGRGCCWPPKRCWRCRIAPWRGSGSCSTRSDPAPTRRLHTHCTPFSAAVAGRPRPATRLGGRPPGTAPAMPRRADRAAAANRAPWDLPGTKGVSKPQVRNFLSPSHPQFLLFWGK